MKTAWTNFVVGCIIFFGWALIHYAHNVDQACVARDGVLVRSFNGYTCVKAQVVTSPSTKPKAAK